MTRVLSVLLGLVLITAHVSKWYLNVGPRLNFYLPFLLLFTVLVAIDWLRRPFVVPRPLTVLMGLKLLFPLSILLTVPAVMMAGRVPLDVFSKGLVSECVNAMGIVAVICFATRLDAPARRRMVNWYLVAVAFSAAFTLAEGVGIYGFGTDVDQVVTEHMPLWSADAPSVEEDRWGASSGQRFYRLTGLTGDPNHNAVTFLLAMPVLFLRLQERSSLRVAGLLILSLAIIGQSLSLTAIPQAMLLLAFLSLRHLRRAKTAVAATLVLLIGAAAYLWTYQQLIIQEVLRYKLAPTGTTAAHLEIARAAIDIWRDNLFGVGISGFQVYSPDFSAHNSYLQALVELGPVGVIAMAVSTLYCMRVGLAARNNLGFAVFLAVATLLVSAIGLDILRRVEFQLVIHMLAAFALLDARELARARSRTMERAHAPGTRDASFPTHSPPVIGIPG